MEQDTHNKNYSSLKSQLRDAYGKLTYTYTCHNKMCNRMLSIDHCYKIFQIILSIITVFTIILSILLDATLAAIVGVISSASLLYVNVYLKDFNLCDIANEHRKTQNELWKIREEYVSLLTDFNQLDYDDIIERRDDLQKRTAMIYENAPRTDSKAYKKAQKALKIDEEQKFSDEEIDDMLPSYLKASKK